MTFDHCPRNFGTDEDELLIKASAYSAYHMRFLCWHSPTETLGAGMLLSNDTNLWRGTKTVYGMRIEKAPSSKIQQTSICRESRTVE